ncbi:MAG: integrase, partial [Candidatus Aenigmatarchaeota archaeon]
GCSNPGEEDEGGSDGGEDEEQDFECHFCSVSNQSNHTECRNCGRPLNLENKVETRERKQVLEKLSKLEEKGVLQKLEDVG